MSPTREYSALHPDGDGTACLDLPQGFAPACWTRAIPADVQEAQLVQIIDGDTFEVLTDGVSNRVRICRADTPETQTEQHCGGAEATAFATYALGFNDTPGIPAYPPDLDCGEIGITVQVIGGDPHGLDRDRDGVGCE